MHANNPVQWKMQGQRFAQAVLLLAATLQLQSAGGSPAVWTNEPALEQIQLSDILLLQRAKQAVEVRYIRSSRILYVISCMSFIIFVAFTLLLVVSEKLLS